MNSDNRSLQSGLLEKIGWLGLAEIVSKLSRLVAVVVLARVLSPIEFGVAAMAVVVFELSRVVAQGGVSATYVTAPLPQLQQVAWCCQRLSWGWHTLAAMLFLVAATALEQNTDLVGLGHIALAIAPTFLLYPLVALRAFEAQRCMDMKRLAWISAACVSLDNLTVALTVGSLGIFSVALGKLCAATAWVGLWLCFPQPLTERAEWPELVSRLRFSCAVLAADVVKAVRAHTDVLLASMWLSAYETGIYTFARNAGVGLSLSLVAAVNTVFLPWVSATLHKGHHALVQTQFRRLFSGLCLLFATQALASFVYIPVLFGAQWQMAPPLVAVACMGAMPRIWIEMKGMLFRASRVPQRDAKLQLHCCLVFLCTFLALLAGGLAADAWQITVAALVASFLTLIPDVFNKESIHAISQRGHARIQN